MKLIAHRGMGAKENTMLAFINAINSDKTVGFECDIRYSKDKKIMVIHDVYLERVFNEPGLVSEKTGEELNSLGIPYLEDVLKINTDKIIMVEVKDISINPEELVSVLESSKRNIYLQSFYNDYLHKILKLNPKFKVGPLNNILNKELSYNEYDFVGLFSGFATDEILAKYKKQHIEVFLWGLLESTSKYRDYFKKLNDVYLIVDL